MKNAQPPVTGPLSILYSVGYFSDQPSHKLILSSIRPKPLKNWTKAIKDGQIKRISDRDIQGSAIELVGGNVAANYIAYPADLQGKLSVQMPYLVMLIKNVMISYG